MRKHAEGTKVEEDRTRLEIERTLKRYGATAFGYATENNQAVVMFAIAGRKIRCILQLPDPEDPDIAFSVTGRNQHSSGQMTRRTPQAQAQAYAQEVRRRWRSLATIIKAKLIAIDDGITTIEREFLPDTLLPSGQTVAEWIEPQVQRAYQTGEMPPALAWLPVRELPEGEKP